MIAVADVEAASRWYQQVLGASSGHGGAEYEQLLVDGYLIMQLHRLDAGHHHGTIGDPQQPVGNGLVLWFEAADFDAAVRRIRAVGAQVVADVHVNPNAGHREVWIRDLDGYLVVFAEPDDPPLSGGNASTTPSLPAPVAADADVGLRDRVCREQRHVDQKPTAGPGSNILCGAAAPRERHQPGGGKARQFRCDIRRHGHIRSLETAEGPE